MPKQFQKSLQDYVSKIIKQNPINHQSWSFQPTKNWILSGCKHPQTLSFALDRNQNNSNNSGNDHDAAPTLSDIDCCLYKNFRSIYVKEDHEDYYTKKGSEDHQVDRHHEANNNHSPRGILFGSPRFLEPPPDLCGSQRFFVEPGLSCSLMEESRNSVMAASDDVASGSGAASTSTSTILNDQPSIVANDSKDAFLPEDCIAVLMYSSSPYDDFRRSMQEMVEARMQNNEKVDWDFMQEFLICYLNMNEKKSYKFILSAFVDLIVVLRKNSRLRRDHEITEFPEEKNEKYVA